MYLLEDFTTRWIIRELWSILVISIPSPSPTSVIFMDGAMMTKWKTYPFNFSSESAQWPQEKLPFFPYKNKNKSPVFVWAVFLWMRAGTGHTGPSSLHVFIPAKDCSRLFHRLALHQPQRKNESPGALLGWIGKNQQTPSRSKQMVAPHPQYKVDYWTRGQIQCRTEQGNLFFKGRNWDKYVCTTLSWWFHVRQFCGHDCLCACI